MSDQITEIQRLAATELRQVADHLDTKAGELKAGAARAERNGDNRSNIQHRYDLAEAFAAASVYIAQRAGQLSGRLVAPRRHQATETTQLELLGGAA